MSNIDYTTAHGFLTLGERELLKQLASKVPPNGLILNIGVEYGASLVCLRSGNPTARIIGMDLDNSKCEAKDSANVLMTGNSQDFVKDWKERCHLIFIDGEHTFKGVTSDLIFAERCDGGDIVALHDCRDSLTGKPHFICPEVDDAVLAWFANHGDWQLTRHVDSTKVFIKVESAKHESPAPKRHSAHIQPARSSK